MARRKQRQQLDLLTLNFIEAHPADAADVLERLSYSEVAGVLSVVPIRIAEPVLALMQPMHAAHSLLLCTEDFRHGVLHRLPAQKIVAIVRHFTNEQRHTALQQLPSTVVMACRLLLRHPENTVGAIVNSSALALIAQTSVKEALSRVREIRDGAADYLYVIDAQRVVIGYVSLSELVRTNQHQTLSSIMHFSIPKLSALTTLDAAANHPGWSQFHMLPVVERDQRFIGAIRYADLHQYLSDSSASKSVPLPPEQSLAVMAHGYWQVFDMLLSGITSALPRNGSTASDKKS